jgi:hypothetical protein
MAFFTFIARYREGTDIDQVHAGNVQDATRKWIDRLFGTVPGLSWEDHEELLDDLLKVTGFQSPREGRRGRWGVNEDGQAGR